MKNKPTIEELLAQIEALDEQLRNDPPIDALREALLALDPREVFFAGALPEPPRGEARRPAIHHAAIRG